MALNKKYNQYQELISAEVYEKTPKAVFAALAVSFALLLNDEDIDNLDRNLIREWETLYKNGIVPQKPVKQ